MTLSPNEAAETLGEIARTERRSAEAHEYTHASPHFILWGLVWVAGYSGTHMLSDYGFVRGTNWLWFGLVLLGALAGSILGKRQYRGLALPEREAGKIRGRRIGMMMLAVWLFVIATFIVLRPVNPVAVGAWIPLIVALAYAIFGIWCGLRFLYAGIAVAALTLGGWLYLRDVFLLWMAFVGGGALILAGLWLRKV